MIDLFRDRLEFVQVELADAKSRNSELEHLQVRDAVALKASSENIVTMGKFLIYKIVEILTVALTRLL